MLLAKRRRTEPGQGGGHGGTVSFSACPSASSWILKLGFLIRAASTFQTNQQLEISCSGVCDPE